MADLFFYADIYRCVGCHACEVACQQEHGGDAQKRIKVEESEVLDCRGTVKVNFIPLVFEDCFVESCERDTEGQPACMAVCPTRALQFDDLKGFSSVLSKNKSVSLLRVIR